MKESAAMFHRLRLVPMFALVLTLAGISALHPGRVHAYEGWCFDDPIISVNGRLVDV